jgi:hypothetical protein
MATAIAVESAAAAAKAAEVAKTAKINSWVAADFAISNLTNRQAASYATECGIYEASAVAYAVALAEKAEFDAIVAQGLSLYAVAAAKAAK